MRGREQQIGGALAMLLACVAAEPALAEFFQCPGPNFEVVMEAEAFDANIPGSVDVAVGVSWAMDPSPIPGFSGTGVMMVPNGSGGPGDDAARIPNGPRMDYVVNFTQAGPHTVYVRAYDPGGSDDSVHFGLNGAPDGNRIGYGGTATAWQWESDDNRTPADPATINVPSPGQHTFSIWLREDGSPVDKIVLSPNGSLTDPQLDAMAPCGGGGGGEGEGEGENIALDSESHGTLDTTNAGNSLPPTINSFTFQHTLGAAADSNRMVVVFTQTEANANGNVNIGNVTYNGTPMTLASGSVANTSVTVTQETRIYYLGDASLPAPGTHDVVITLSAPAELVDVTASAVSLTGVDQAGPTATATNADEVGTATSIDIAATTAGAWVLDVAGSGQQAAAWTPGANQTLLFAQAGSSSAAAGSYEVAAAAGTVTMSWTNTGSSNRLAHSAAVFVPAPSAPPPVQTEIIANINPPFIQEGDYIVLTAPPGTGHQWTKDGADIADATNRQLVFPSITMLDEGTYTVTYDDGTKVVLTTPPFVITVNPAGTIPVSGMTEIFVLVTALAVAGSIVVRRGRT